MLHGDAGVSDERWGDLEAELNPCHPGAWVTWAIKIASHGPFLIQRDDTERPRVIDSNTPSRRTQP